MLVNYPSTKVKLVTGFSVLTSHMELQAQKLSRGVDLKCIFTSWLLMMNLNVGTNVRCLAYLFHKVVFFLYKSYLFFPQCSTKSC